MACHSNLNGLSFQSKRPVIPIEMTRRFEIQVKKTFFCLYFILYTLKLAYLELRVNICLSPILPFVIAEAEEPSK